MGVAKSTRRSYRAGLKLYKQFCSTYAISPLPATELTLRFFCAQASSSVTAPTIAVYMSAIRLYHLEKGYPDPTANAPLLKYLLQGIKRSQSTRPTQKHPITPDLLKRLKPLLKSSGLSSSQWHLYWAAFTLAFYAFFRVSEYTAPARHRATSHTLKLSQVTLRATSIKICLTKTKTAQFQVPSPIHIGATKTSTCPVKALTSFLSHRSAPSTSPLFTFEDGSFLTPRLVSNTLKSVISRAGLDSSGYSSHSFRIGAATTAAASGVPDHLVQKLGRWSSDAYKSYIRPQTSTLQAAAPLMALPLD